MIMHGKRNVLRRVHCTNLNAFIHRKKYKVFRQTVCTAFCMLFIALLKLVYAQAKCVCVYVCVYPTQEERERMFMLVGSRAEPSPRIQEEVA